MRSVCSTSAFIWAISASTESKRCSARRCSRERHPDRLAVEVAVEAEQVGLDQHRGGARLVEGRSPAHRDGARVHRAVRPGEVPGVDAVRRQGDVVVHRHVGRREPQFRAAPPVAAHHRPAHLVRPTQEFGRPRHVARGDEGADPGGGHRARHRRRSARPRRPRSRARRRDGAAARRCPCARARSGSPRPPPPDGPRVGRPGPPGRTPPPLSSARASSKGTTRVRSIPHSARSSSFCSSEVSCLGADSGRTTAAGWRSKVTTTVERPSAAARSERSRSRARCPRWTPS